MTDPKPSMVRSLLEPSPSLAFNLIRKNEDGSETAIPFRCRLLRQAQTTEALEAAQKHAMSREQKGFQDIYKEAQGVEILRLAVVHVDLHERGDGTKHHLPMFVTSEQLRESLDTEEMAQMLSAYELTRAHFGFSELDDEQVEAAVDALADELAGPFFLSRLASDEWPHLIYRLARLVRFWRPAKLPTPSDSPSTSGSSPSSSESGTTESSTLPELHSAELPLEPRKTPKVMSRDEAKGKVAAARAKGTATPKS